MRVKDNSGGENGVQNRVEGPADEGSDGKRDEAGGDKAMLVSTAPIVGPQLIYRMHTAQRSSGSCHGWGNCGGQVRHRSLILVSCVVHCDIVRLAIGGFQATKLLAESRTCSLNSLYIQQLVSIHQNHTISNSKFNSKNSRGKGVRICLLAEL